MELKDTYKTIANPSEEVLYKEKNSKFFGYSYPVNSQEEIKIHLEYLKKQHFGAVHFCYAYQIGIEKPEFRANDDGEPSHSAGMPIYGQIQSFELTNILIVVVRYFGGTKLGVSGLLTAYKTTAKMALEASTIIEKTIDVTLKITFDYKNINTVMRIIKEKKLQVISQKMELTCEIKLTTRKKNVKEISNIFKTLFEISLTKL